MIENKEYFVDQINSSKAYQFCKVYHNTHTGFKSGTLNLGIFKQNNKQLVGVSCWGSTFFRKENFDRFID